MKTKNTAVFLIIASVIVMIRNLSSFIFAASEGKFEYHWYDYLSVLGGLMTPVGMTLWAYSYLNPRFKQAKAAPILILSGSGIWIIFSVYFNVLYFSTSNFQYAPLIYMIDHLSILFPVSLLILAITLLKKYPGNLKTAAYWLFAGSLVSLVSTVLSHFAFLYSFGRNIYDTPWGFMQNLFSVLSIVYPLAVLILSIQLIRNALAAQLPETADSFTFSDTDTLDNFEPETQTVPDKVTGYPTVIDWISDFLLTMIPLLGLVFLIWRGQNKTDRTRRNWAIATLFWTALSLIIFLLFIFSVVPYINSGSPALLVILLIIAMLLLCGFALSTKMRNDDFDYPFEQPDAPTVGQFFGWQFILSLPVAGLICLIIWATDMQNQVRRQWALASLLRMAITAVYFLHLYKFYHSIT